MKKINLTLAGTITAFLWLFAVLIFEIDVFEMFVETLQAFEEWEVDEVIIPMLILVGAYVADIRQKNQKQKLEMEKKKIYEAMLSSSHHILNNCLNQMQIIKLAAEKTPGFDPQVLKMYDQIVEEANTQIKRLGEVLELDGESIKSSVRPQD